MKINPTRIGIPRGGRHHGFTLVELLVSITIIIALAALVFAITGKVRANAQQVNAISSLRQIGIAHVAYASENNGAINIMRDAGEVGSGYEGGGNAWVSNTFWGRAQPYLFAGIDTKDQKLLAAEIKSSLNALFNTSDLKTMAGTPFSGISAYGDLSGISVPLGFNLKLRPAWRAAPLRVSSIADPSRILYCTYGRYFIEPIHGSIYTPLPLPGDTRRGIYYLPNRKTIACFLDGRVETISPPIPVRFFE